MTNLACWILLSHLSFISSTISMNNSSKIIDFIFVIVGQIVVHTLSYYFAQISQKYKENFIVHPGDKLKGYLYVFK